MRRQHRRGVSYQLRVKEVNEIYDQHCKSGLSNRAIWLRYIYPRYGISERTFYNLLKASCDPSPEVEQVKQLSLFDIYDI
jgi:hypothetical protein